MRVANRGRIQALLIASLLLVASYVVGFSWRAPTSTGPSSGTQFGPLVVESSCLDFGTQGFEDAFELVVPVTNENSREVTVAGFRKSCDCSAVEPEAFSLAPGETLNVTVTLDLTPSTESELKSIVRDFATTVLPVLDRNPATVSPWQITGSVRSPYVVDPPIIDFETSLLHGEQFEPREVHAVCETGLQSIEAICDSEIASVSVCREQNSDRKFRVSVLPSHSLNIGDHEFLVRLSGHDRKGHLLPVGGFRVVARVVNVIEVVPSEVKLGVIGDDQQVYESEVVLHSRLGLPIDVLKLEASPGIEVTRTDDDDAHAYRIQLKKPSSEHQRSSVRFYVQSPNKPPVWVEVPVSYRKLTKG